MALPIVAFATPAAAFPVAPAQTARIELHEGAGAPHGTWQVFNETQILYFHPTTTHASPPGTPPLATQPNPGCYAMPAAVGNLPLPSTPVSPSNTCAPYAAVMDFMRNGARGEPMGEAEVVLAPFDRIQFDSAAEISVQDDTTILRMDAQVLATGLAPTSELLLTVYRRQAGTGSSPDPSVLPPGGDCMDGQYPPANPAGTKKGDPFDPYDDFPVQIRLRPTFTYNLDVLETVDWTASTPIFGGSLLNHAGNGNSPRLLGLPSVPYTGQVEFGLTPPTLTRGESLCAILMINNQHGAGNDVAGVGYAPLGYYSVSLGELDVPAFLRVTSDSARVNTWTEDRLGGVTNAFPSARTTVESERRITIHTVLSETWGAVDCANLRKHPNPNIVPSEFGIQVPQPNTDAEECRFDALDQNKMRIAVRNKTPGSKDFNRYLCLDQGRGFQCDDKQVDPLYGLYVGCCDSREVAVPDAFAGRSLMFYTPWCAGVTSICPWDDYNTGDIGGYRQGLGKFEYTLRYGSEFPDGIYEIDFYHAEKNWHARTRVTVGGTDWTFKMAPGEAAGGRANVDSTHRVALGETTEFTVRLTNNGAGAGVFGIAVPTPGDGWLATVTPSVANLLPRQHQDFVVTVTPPAPGNPDAFAGKQKIVSVVATSVADNSIKTLYLEVELTAERKSGVEVIPAVRKVELRPGQTVPFPVTVRNSGTIRDLYVVTGTDFPQSDPTSGVQATGWSAIANPSFVNVLAASREEVIMTVTAPVEAVPGTSFQLNVSAINVVDNLVRDSELVPVLVQIVDRFHGLTYCPGYVGWYDDFGQDDPTRPDDIVDRAENLPATDPLQAADRCEISPRYNPQLPTCAEAAALPFQSTAHNYKLPC
ncbi:MAG TPA: hypothetical protein VFH47_06660, partial [Candidatus Thermoplasmatota archaeon]|nr:hypothetical protein [Candidatus Thermoplasmatota archaeon]